MFPSMIRICRSDPIRIIRTIYGVPYDIFPLFFNVLRYTYTDYTVFFRHTAFFPESFVKKIIEVRAFARVRRKRHRIIRIIRIKHAANYCKSTFTELYGFQITPYDTV